MQTKKCILHGKVVTYLQSEIVDLDKTLVFLHGWMQSKDSFSEIFKILDTKNISYISLDLPGFWGTDVLSDSMQIEDYGVFVIDFIQKIWLSFPTLVGHSFGGRISIYLGSFYTNISNIVLIGAGGIAPKMNPIRLGIVKIGKTVFSIPWLQKIWDTIKLKVSAPDYKTAGNMTQIYRNTIENDLQHYMKQIHYPTLMIWWDMDDQVPTHEAKIMHEHIQTSQLKILSGSHFIHQEEPEKIEKMILDFIKKYI